MAGSGPGKLFNVEGMVVLITGGGTGIGLMMTKAFALHGAAKVYIVGRRRDRLDTAAKLSSNIIPIVGDVTSKDSLRQIAEQVKHESGFLNVLCLNHGYMEPRVSIRPSQIPVHEFAKQAMEINPDDWTRTFSINCVSVAFNMFAFLELLDAGNKQGNCAPRQSQIIVTGSIAGYIRGPEGFGAYTPSKMAVTHMVKQFAGYLVPYSIRVNAIAPGFFPSEMFDELFAGSDMQSNPDRPYGENFIPAERLGNTEDIIGTLLYMAGPAGAYINGNINVLDGGRLSQLMGTY